MQGLLISDMCTLDGEKCKDSWTATPTMDLPSAARRMSEHGISQVAVVLEHVQNLEVYQLGFWIENLSVSLTGS